ncbi:MAG: cytochrome c-type biogenesis protein CcmH [Actinobacteria bacterium]|jgi:cytochrome c-type biogenesis protein CcmH/NrfF|nr:cytochrome c-type biogenesis protein CcmH [Actinomycetota bacterium]
MVGNAGDSLTRSKRVKLRTLVLVSATIIALAGIGFSLLTSSSHLTKAQRIQQIESTVKCPSCEGISALDSNTAGAFAVRNFVQKEVDKGESSSQIISQLQASYGPNILMTPPASYGGTVIEILPFAFAALMIALVAFFGYRRNKRYLSRSGEPKGSFGSDALGQGSKPASGKASDSLVVDASNGRERANSKALESQVPPGKAERRPFKKLWPLYLGIILIVAGIGSGLYLIKTQQDANNQALAEVTQAQNQAQEILQARVLANKGQDVQALQLLSSVLKSDPNQPIALAYQGWLLRQAGEKDKNQALITQGQQLLQKAVKLDPGYPDARVFLGLILFQDRHDVSGAITQFNAFLADKPSVSFLDATKPMLVAAYKKAGLPVPAQLLK